ncbi:MAG: flippase-like domain-containing protein [Euryarchaeota archaeon]|nr:flippase-like domain-containing protein [Euryarchaeota archaeon]
MSTNSSGNEGFRKRHRKSLTLLLTAIGVLIALLLIYIIGIEEVVKAFTTYSVRQLVVFIVLYIFSWVLRGLKFYLILRASDIRIGVLRSIGLAILGGFANIFGMFQIGDVTRVIAVKFQANKDFGVATSPILTDMLSGTYGLITLVLVFILLFSPDRASSWTRLCILFIILLAIATIGVLKYGRQIGDFLSSKKPNRALMFLANIVYTMRVALNSKLFYASIVISIISWLIEGVSFSTLVPMIDWYNAVIAEALGNMVKIVPVTPGGMGTFEGVVALYLSKFGIEISEAFSYALSYHLMTKVILAVIGAPLASILIPKASDE